MALLSTSRNYGTIAKWMHWLTAILFLATYASVYFRHWFTVDKTPENWTALQLHLSFGVTIGMLVILRVLWKMIDNHPRPEPGTDLEHRASKWGHRVLYVMMIIMPLTGYLGTGVNTELFFLFDVTKFESSALFQFVVSDGMGLTFKAFESPVDFVHKEIGGKWLVWLLILGHALAGLYHHFIKKDRTLLRMTITGNGAG